MICDKRVARDRVLVVGTFDFLYTSRMLGERVYLAAYVSAEDQFYVDPDMCVNMEHQLKDCSEESMTVCSVGTLFGIVPLESHENLEEGLSGEVLFYYQVLLDDGTMVLVSSLALHKDSLTAKGKEVPHFQDWLTAKLG